MSLIYLSREFDNGQLQFDLPGLDHGFVRILVSARIDSYGDHTLELEFNGTGNFAFYTDTPRPSHDPVGEGPSIPLGFSTAEGNPSALFNSEILFGLLPSSAVLSMQSCTGNIKVLPGSTGGPFLPAQSRVTGSRKASALNYARLFIASAGVTGIARLFWYPHISELRAEI
jgi:hypothetical protein